MGCESYGDLAPEATTSLTPTVSLPLVLLDVALFLSDHGKSMQWIALRTGPEPQLLSLDLVFDKRASPRDELQINTVDGVVTAHPCMKTHLGKWQKVDGVVVAAANYAYAKGAVSAIIRLSIDTNGLQPHYAFHPPECTIKQETTMAKASTIEILKKKTQKADDAEVDANVEAEDTDNGDEGDAEEEAPAKPAAKKTPAKKAPTPEPEVAASKTAAKPKSAKPSTSEITNTANEIENYTEVKAHKALSELLEAQSFDEFKIGGILSRIQLEGWVGEYENFRTFVTTEHGINYRKAMYLISIYNDLVESGVSWNKVKRLGWTKLKELSSILTTDNVDEIVDAVSGMNVLQVIAYVAEFNSSGDKAKAKDAGEKDDLKTKTFKLFAPQAESVDMALDKAMKVGGTESSGAALEYICVDFLSGNKKAPAKKESPKEAGDLVPLPTTGDELVQFIKAVADKYDDDEVEEALSEVLSAVADVFPDAAISVKLGDDAEEAEEEGEDEED